MLLTVLVLATAAVAALVMLVGQLGPLELGLGIPTIENIMQKVKIAEAARAFTLARDTSISPLEAGRAFATMQGNRPASPGWHAIPVEQLPSPPWESPLPAGLFAGYTHNALIGAPNVTVIDSAARHHLSAAEMAWLAALAHHPAWALFRRFARAKAADLLGARFALPFAPDASPYEAPIPAFATTKAYAYANAGRVAYYLARGQRDSAETAAREEIPSASSGWTPAPR